MDRKKKKAKATKTVARKKVPAKKALAAKPKKKAAKKVAARKSVKKPSVRAKASARARTPKAATKTRTPRTARKAPIARKKAPVAQVQEAKPVEVPLPTEPLLSVADASHEPVRGGYHDAANHSNPTVQLQRQHLQTQRSPERRHTMRGH